MIARGKAANMELAGIWIDSSQKLFHDEYVGTCPKCGTYNEVWKKREKTVKRDVVYCWHCGCKVQLK